MYQVCHTLHHYKVLRWQPLACKGLITADGHIYDNFIKLTNKQIVLFQAISRSVPL